jgi:hypothetical protein
MLLTDGGNLLGTHGDADSGAGQIAGCRRFLKAFDVF